MLPKLLQCLILAVVSSEFETIRHWKDWVVLIPSFLFLSFLLASSAPSDRNSCTLKWTRKHTEWAMAASFQPSIILVSDQWNTKNTANVCVCTSVYTASLSLWCRSRWALHAEHQSAVNIAPSLGSGLRLVRPGFIYRVSSSTGRPQHTHHSLGTRT